jgi:predicted benzoate:H+ symporter BenE
MTDTPDSPQAGFTEAVQGLSDQTRQLVRHEIAAALRETAGKAKQSVPAAALLASSAVLGVFTIAASYRLSLRVLERWLSPAAAALVATAGYGTGAACAAILGAQQLRHNPLPFPGETARETGETLAAAADRAGSAATAR